MPTHFQKLILISVTYHTNTAVLGSNIGISYKKDKNKDDNTKKSLLIIFSVPSSEQFLVIKCFFNTEVCPSGSYMLDNFPGPCEKILA